MMENNTIRSLFFRNRHLLFLTIMIICVSGFSALDKLARIEDPRLVNRNPVIITEFPGSAARVESLVTEKLEKQLKEISEIKKIESTSRTGISFISLELQDHVDDNSNKYIFSKIRDKLNDAQKFLPPGSAPQFDENRGATAFTLIYALKWENDHSLAQMNMLSRLAKELADRFRNVSGTEIVRIYGDVREEYQVILDADELAALRLSGNDISKILTAADAKTPAGALRSKNNNLAIEVSGELDSLSRIASIPIKQNESGAMITLGDIATIKKAWQNPVSEIAISNDKRCIYIAIRMESQERIDNWVKSVYDTARVFSDQLGEGISLSRIFDQSIYTNKRLKNLTMNLIAGCFIVVFVIFLMMGWRSAIIVGAALPLSTAITLFIIMSIGETLHQMSIFGMIIAIGLLIDNAIVITDEVSTRIYQGAGKVEAIENTLRHLFTPLLASTLTTILGFMPVFLLPGNAGDFVRSIATSVIVALVASFFTSMTIIPALAAMFTKRREQWWNSGIKSSFATSQYQRSLLWTLRHPLITISLIISIPIAGFILSSQLHDQFFPGSDRNQFEIRVWLPGEASISQTKNQILQIQDVLKEFPQIENSHWLIGGSFPSVYYNLLMTQENAPFYAQAVLQIDDSKKVAAIVTKLQKIMNEKFCGSQIVVNLFGQGPPIDAPIQFRVYGSDIYQLQKYGEKMRQILSQDPQVVHTQATITGGEPKLWIDANQYEAQLSGLDLKQISSQLQSNSEGTFGGSVLEQLEELPVRIRLNNRYRESLSNIVSTRLISPINNRWIPLSSLGTPQIRPETSGITRYNNQRCNIIKAYVTVDALPVEVAKRNRDKIYQIKINPSYRIELGGSAEEKGKAIRALMTYIPVLITLVIATVVLSFNSFILATIIGFVAILSVGFGLLSLWLCEFPLGFNPIIGMAGLIGVALNDTIVILAALKANQNTKNDKEQIVEEVIGGTRHILSTTLTTIGGFIPLLIFTGGSFWPPLAIVIIGGVAGATTLSLVFAPCLYHLFYGYDKE